MLFLLCCLPLSANAAYTSQQIQTIRDSANQYQNTSKEVFFLKKGLHSAEKNKDYTNEVSFLLHLTRNSYNRWLPDSVSYWGDKGVALAKEHACYNELFDIMSLLCLRDIFLEEYECAYDRASEMFKLSKELNQTEGMVASFEAMGILYRQTSRPSQALDSYKEGLKLLRQTATRPSQEMQFICYIVEILLNQGNTKEAKSYIDAYQRLLNDFSQNKYVKYGAIPLDRCRKLVECFLTDYYIQEHDYRQAEIHYLASAQYTHVNDVYVQYYFDLNTISYHQYITKTYPVALHEVDKLLNEEKAPEVLVRKADILYDMGHYQESVDVFKYVIHLKDSISDYELNRQLNGLRSRLDVNKLELEKKELEAKRNELKMRVFFMVLVIVLVVLFFVVVILIRTSKVKNILKKNEKDLKIAKEKAEESNRLKTVFIQNMSHEIRTPLNAIVGFSSLLTEMPEERAQFSKLIEENSNLLLKLIDDLLNISVIEAHNHTSLTIESCDLTQCCRKAIDSVQSLVQKPIQLTFTPECDHYKIKSDPMRLHQIMTNLLTNALKYTEQGEINLSFHTMADKSRFALSVTDSGVGIPDDKKEAIFERFVKLDDFKQGTGLGLYISRTIVTAMHGRIYVDSNYHAGARFIAELPIILKE